VPSALDNLVVDCADAYELAKFWTQVLDRPIHDESDPGDDEVAIELESGITLLFIEVPEVKTIKNRLHLCLRPDVPRDTEVERLLGLGATLVDDRRNPDGSGWAVLGDPEGNEFCVLRSTAERPGTAA
jgi:predicted enzyme related to lactoylglutathione lyase